MPGEYQASGRRWCILPLQPFLLPMPACFLCWLACGGPALKLFTHANDVGLVGLFCCFVCLDTSLWQAVMGVDLYVSH